MKIIIVGCGQIGQQVGERLHQDGAKVFGVKRSDEDWSYDWKCIAADASSEAGVKRIKGNCPKPDAIIVTANPGLRGGGDNKLKQMATLLTKTFKKCVLIYTSSTAVYVDAPGQSMDEEGQTDVSDRAKELLSIESVYQKAGAVILRLAALVGPNRMHIRKRIADADDVLTVRGSLARRFNYVHDLDVVDILFGCVHFDVPAGIYNISSSDELTAQAYFQMLIDESDKSLRLEEQEPFMPDRIIDNTKFLTHCGDIQWRTPLAEA